MSIHVPAIPMFTRAPGLLSIALNIQYLFTITISFAITQWFTIIKSSSLIIAHYHWLLLIHYLFTIIDCYYSLLFTISFDSYSLAFPIIWYHWLSLIYWLQLLLLALWVQNGFKTLLSNCDRHPPRLHQFFYLAVGYVGSTLGLENIVWIVL